MKKAKHTIDTLSLTHSVASDTLSNTATTKNPYTKKQKKQKFTSMALIAFFALVAILVFACEESGDIGGVTITPCEATDKTTLVKCVEAAMEEQGTTTTPNLNKITLAPTVVDLSYLFSNDPYGPLHANRAATGFDVATFDGDISKWDTSQVKTMTYMFFGASTFNQDISTKEVTVDGKPSYTAWDTSNVEDMAFMFYAAKAFNQPIGNWNTSKVTSMAKMFAQATIFNQPIGNWNTSKVGNMSTMFSSTGAFNQNINTKQVTVDANNSYTAWDTSAVTTMIAMFSKAKEFNQDIGNWNTSAVTDMTQMFFLATVFDQDISTKQVTVGDKAPYTAWKMGKVTAMSSMFFEATNFNKNLTSWTWDPAPTYSIVVGNMFGKATSMLNENLPKVCSEATAPYPSAGGYVSNSCR